MARWTAGIILATTALLGSKAAGAGLYHPDTLGFYDIDQNGFARVPEFETFAALWTILKRADNPDTPEGQLIRQAIREREKKNPSKLSVAEQVSLTADMLRLRRD